MSNALRNIAEHELDQCFHDLNPVMRDQLATSLVRRWIGNDGNAVNGQKLRLRVEPGKPRFYVELVLDDNEWHRYPNE